MSREIPLNALQALQSEIHYEFRQVKLLIQALTHSSHANEHDGVHNERLEFLGDAVLELAISSALFHKYPEAQEGHLTKMRSCLVSENALAQLARRIGLGHHLLLGKGEESQGGREKNSVLSDAVEAVFGAVFLDGGLSAVQTCVNFLYESHWPLPPETFRPRDHKSMLQEVTQKIWKARPTYTLKNSHGPEHAKVYRISLILPDATEVEWEDRSLRKAEQGAAARALEVINTRLADAQEADICPPMERTDKKKPG